MEERGLFELFFYADRYRFCEVIQRILFGHCLKLRFFAGSPGMGWIERAEIPGNPIFHRRDIYGHCVTPRTLDRLAHKAS